MENRLKRLPQTMNEAQADMLSRELSEFGEGAYIDDNTVRRIQSSVMRKAGIKMRKTDRTKVRKGRIALIAAAAALMMTSVTAGAAVIFGKRDSVEKYLGDSAVQNFDTVDPTKEETVTKVKDGDYSMTIDSVVRMAGRVYLVGVTVTGETDTAKNYINSIDRNDGFNVMIMKQGTETMISDGQGLNVKRSDGFPLPEDKSVDEYGSISSMTDFIDPVQTAATAVAYLPDGTVIKQDFDLEAELYGTYDTTVPYTDKDGRVLNVTPIGMIFDFYAENENSNDIDYLEFADGSRDDPDTGLGFGTMQSNESPRTEKTAPGYTLFWKTEDIASLTHIHFFGSDYYRQ